MTRSTWALAAATGLAVVGAAWLAVGATGTAVTTTAGRGGGVVTETTHPSLLDEEGPSVLIVLAMPAVIAGAALAARRRKVALTLGWLLVAFCFLAILSIGIFVLPVAALILMGGYAAPRSPTGGRA